MHLHAFACIIVFLLAGLSKEITLMIFSRSLRSSAHNGTSGIGCKLPSDLMASLSVPLLLIGLWALSSRLGWISQDILPSPQDVLLSLADMYHSGILLSNAGSSFSRLIWGLVAGVMLGAALGVWMGSSLLTEELLLPTFKIFNLVPPLGWIPLLTMLMGIEDSMKIMIIAKAVMTPVTLNTLQGMKNVSLKFKEVAKVHQLTTVHKARLLYIPSILPFFITGVRYGFSNAWMALVAVELLASSEGLGYLLSEGRQLFQLDVVMAMVFIIGVLGWLTDKLLEKLDNKFQLLRNN